MSFERLATALADRYRLERELGAGGMATVYLAEDMKHDRKVAIKVLKPELAAVLGAERFVQEIKTTAALSHPHILPLFDSGTADGYLFYVMPYIEGETIRDKLNRETQFGIEEAVRITTEVADALDYAHRHGVIHRDIKPENILLHDGRAMVMDFGIALAVSAAAGGRMTETGLSLGTPHYMSPEQATADKQITARSDIYSLASVLFEMLAGVPPHEGGSAQQVIMRIIADTPRPVTELRKSVSPNVAAAVAKALEKLPADRFDSAKAFGAALADQHFRTERVFPGDRIANAGERRTMAIRFAAAALVVVAAMAGGWLLGRRAAAVSPRVGRVEIDIDSGIDLAASNPPEVCCNQNRPALTAIAFSPDGRTLVFAGNSGTTRQLFRRAIDESRAIPIAGTEGAEYPVFSPNGASLLFWADGWLRVVPLAGGPSVQVARVAELRQFLGASWGDDNRIVFRDASVAGLRSVPASGGGAVEALPSSPNAHLPQVLPGSKVILYTTGSGDEAGRYIESLRLQTGVRDTVLEDAADARYLDGHLVFARSGALMTVPFDPEAVRTTGAPSGVLADVMQSIGGLTARTDAAQFAVSSAGHLAYLTGGLTPEFTFGPVWFSRTGSATWVEVPPASYVVARISPDGRSIALAAPSQFHPGLRVVERGPQAVVHQISNQIVGSLAWSPDSRRITYGSGKGLWVIDAAGGAAPERLLDKGFEVAEWTPQGDLLGVEEDSTGLSVLKAVSLKTRVMRPVLAENGSNIWFPALSLDHRWLAYVVWRGGPLQLELVIRAWPSLEGRRVIATGVIVGAAWGPGGELFYAESGAFEQRLMSAHIDANAGGEPGVPRELFRGGLGGNVPIRSWDVLPDGQRFLGLSLKQDSAHANGYPPLPRINLILNWAQELKSGAVR